MSDVTTVQFLKDSKLNIINKKIIEIKKKIQLSEGQRKACFEECDSKKKDNAENISRLKKELKDLQLTFSKAKNNQDIVDNKKLKDQQSLSFIKRKNLIDSTNLIDEDIIRLRKKLDLVRYESNKQQKKLTGLLEEYEELMSGKSQKLTEKKIENPGKKKIIRLENKLQRINLMQMEADTVRKKYRSVRSSLKSDASLYGSSLKTLEENIMEQKLEIKRLQNVKDESINLRDITKISLIKQEIDAINTTKKRDGVILDYRQKVEDRKFELERLERMIFPSVKTNISKEDFYQDDDKTVIKTLKESSLYLEEAFLKLRESTGVSKNENVLDRFLSQKTTKDKLQKMRLTTENEKINLERIRQKLMADIEMQKFSETKNSEQNAEELDKLNRQISEQFKRQEKAFNDHKRVKKLLNEVNTTLWNFYDKLRDIGMDFIEEEKSEFEIDDIFKLLYLLKEKFDYLIEFLINSNNKAKIIIEESLTDKFETISQNQFANDNHLIDNDNEKYKNENENENKNDNENENEDERPFFPNFPSAPTPAVPAQQSEDEEDVPTRSILKRQAQLLVDTKSRRKGFNFRR